MTEETLKQEIKSLLQTINRLLDVQCKDEEKRIKRLLSPPEPLSVEDRESIVESKKSLISGNIAQINANKRRMMEL